MLSLLSTNPTLVIQACLVAWIALEISRAVYNVFFHPLRRFPGPTVAGASNLWKMYMEVVRRESPAHLLVQLHQHYGKYAVAAASGWMSSGRGQETRTDAAIPQAMSCVSGPMRYVCKALHLRRGWPNLLRE